MTHSTTTTTLPPLTPPPPPPPPPHQMTKSKNPRRKHPKENQIIQKKKTNNNVESKLQEKPHSWALMRSFFTCKHLQPPPQLQQQQIQQEKPREIEIIEAENDKKSKKMKCYYYSSGSLCNNTKVMQRPVEPPPPSSSPEDRNKKRGLLGSSSSYSSSCKNINGSRGSRSVIKSPLMANKAANNSSSSASASSLSLSSNNSSTSVRGMGFRKLSGCYECRMVIDPVLMMTRDPSLKTTICSCSQCGEIFMKAEHLEVHQAVRHAVSELGPDDTSKNIVEIIFQSSWLKKQFPVCKIDRILKVQNTPKTISKFEEYRDNIKAKATKLPKKHARCIADGNELLRFHCTTFTCSLGLNGSSNLCSSIPNCNICSIIRHGFKVEAVDQAIEPQGEGEGDGEVSDMSTVTVAHSRAIGKGILTTATSGRAHDNARVVCDDEKRAMLVCRVIAGRVKKNVVDGSSNMEEYDSVAGEIGMYSNLDELYVFNPKAILPCFVVIYRGF